jgi:hypothetical protein
MGVTGLEQSRITGSGTRIPAGSGALGGAHNEGSRSGRLADALTALTDDELTRLADRLSPENRRALARALAQPPTRVKADRQT